MMKRIKVYVFAVFLFFSLFPISIEAGREGQVVTKEQVEESLHHYVVEQGPWQSSQIEVGVRSFTPLPLPGGRVEVRIVKPNRGITPGQRRFLLAVEVEGQERARVWVEVEVRVFGEVVVTSRPLAHYETITPEAVRLERRNLSALPTRAFTAIEELVGKQAAHAIEVNQILTPSMVELPRVVRRGSAITLVYESSGLRVEAPGRAAEAGKVGDTIRVENPSSGKMLEGQIVDARTVRVN
ncbi:MAG: flagellar basal body P-ring formation protein FlgA [Deltaproteobacteria bacterium]|nr:flagellar basal body P-ring formation protein FlgA [Deltaproteobacteria bacterium]